MGCGASKGSSSSQSVDITFKPLGVSSMDNFFQKAKDILDDLKALMGPFSEAKDKFLEATGFIEVPGASKYLVVL